MITELKIGDSVKPSFNFLTKKKYDWTQGIIANISGNVVKIYDVEFIFNDRYISLNYLNEEIEKN